MVCLDSTYHTILVMACQLRREIENRILDIYRTAFGTFTRVLNVASSWPVKRNTELLYECLIQCGCWIYSSRVNRRISHSPVLHSLQLRANSRGPPIPDSHETNTNADVSFSFNSKYMALSTVVCCRNHISQRQNQVPTPQ